MVAVSMRDWETPYGGAAGVGDTYRDAELDRMLNS